MPTATAFRLSMYLTLVVSCLCLGYAEWDFLTEGSIVAAIVILLLVVSYWLDDRIELDLRAANQVGFGIGLVVVIWVGYQFVRKDSLIYTFPWPASLLPFLGPLLMILMPAKLLRPKHIGDWWTMQGLGLAAVGLASAMAEDIFFGLLLGLYGLVGIWSLTLFYFRRSAGLLPAIHPNSNDPVPIMVSPSEYVGRVLKGRSVLWQAMGWMLIAMLFSLPLFLVTPRSQFPRWQFSKSGIETGLGDGQIDLTRTGQMRINRDIAFLVTATDHRGQPKTDLLATQRWRAASYQVYAEGTWRFKTLEGKKFLIDRNSMVLAARGPQDTFPPKLHPEQYLLEFSLQQKMLYRILLDPVKWKPGLVSPVASYYPDRWSVWGQGMDGHLASAGQPQRYRQVTYDVPSEEPDLGPPCEISDEVQRDIVANDPDSPVSIFKKVNGIPRLKDYAVELLNKLSTNNLPLRQAIQRADTRTVFQLHPQDYENVARAFHHYLSTSPEFSYSLIIRRTDNTLDPIEDFLLKTKSGQCERFATALTLLCRSVGIPAAYTIGYKGCEAGGFDGSYLVRQDQAHAWSEVFIPRKRTIPEPGKPPLVWHWLTLDPTPVQGEDDSSNSLGDWLGTAKDSSLALFLDFIVGYNPDRRAKTVEALQNWLSKWWWTLLAVPVSVGLMFWFRRWIFPKAIVTEAISSENRPTGLAWFDEFREQLKKLNADLPVGKTWREHLTTLQARWPEQANALTRMVEAFYQARYAEALPDASTEKELAELSQKLIAVEP